MKGIDDLNTPGESFKNFLNKKSRPRRPKFLIHYRKKFEGLGLGRGWVSYCSRKNILRNSRSETLGRANFSFICFRNPSPWADFPDFLNHSLGVYVYRMIRLISKYVCFFGEEIN